MNIVFRVQRNTNESLHNQVRKTLVDAIVTGTFRAGQRLPSTRQLSKTLGVSRNTVVQVYDGLVLDGYLSAQDRSGYFVTDRPDRFKPDCASQNRNDPERDSWTRRLKFRPASQSYIRTPPNSQTYPYPFIYGQIDPSLFPVAAWRECSRQTLAKTEIGEWAGDAIYQDDPQLTEQICSKLLPSRGVIASPDEVLITLGAQNALFVAATLLASPGTRVALENPGYSDMRNAFIRRGADVTPVPVDANGMIVDDRLEHCDLAYVTPSHQYPSAATLSLPRREALLEMADRHDFLVIEDDYENEINFVRQPLPALKSLDEKRRVLYVSSLSKTMFPGLRIGYMVAPPEFIREARALRRQMYRHPPANNQRTVSMFIALGHYDTLVRRLHTTYRERWHLMNRCIREFLPCSSCVSTAGGTSFWVEGPRDLDSTRLAEAALARGVVIEPGEALFWEPDPPRHFFRLGFSSLPTDRIEPGMRILGEVMEELHVGR